MTLAERIKMLRTEKGLTMDMFVYDMNNKYHIELNKGLVSKWENGVNEPSLRYAAYLAKYYDISLDYLIGLTDCKTPANLLAFASKQKSPEPTLKLNHPKPIPQVTSKRRPSLTNDDDFDFEFLNGDN